MMISLNFIGSDDLLNWCKIMQENLLWQFVILYPHKSTKMYQSCPAQNIMDGGGIFKKSFWYYFSVLTCTPMIGQKTLNGRWFLRYHCFILKTFKVWQLFGCSSWKKLTYVSQFLTYTHVKVIFIGHISISR